MYYSVSDAMKVIHGFDSGHVEAAHDSLTINAENWVAEEILVNHRTVVRNGDLFGELEISFQTPTHSKRVTYCLGKDWKGTMEQAIRRFRPSLLHYLTNKIEASPQYDLD